MFYVKRVCKDTVNSLKYHPQLGSILCVILKALRKSFEVCCGVRMRANKSKKCNLSIKSSILYHLFIRFYKRTFCYEILGPPL